MDSDWLQVEELSRQSYFAEEEMQSVTFIRQMEKLGSVFPSRCPADTTGLRCRFNSPPLIHDYRRLLFIHSAVSGPMRKQVSVWTPLLSRAVQMVHREPGGGAEEVLGELVGQRPSDKDAGLWQNVRLDWVRNWDQSCQAAVLLSRLQHTGENPTSASDSRESHHSIFIEFSSCSWIFRVKPL